MLNIEFGEDGLTFTLLFDSYIASTGPGTRITDTRKNCQLNVGMHIPQGWQYSIVTVDYRGYVNLEPRVRATQVSTYYFAGELLQASARSALVGPLEQNYVFRDNVGFDAVVWSPCGEQRNLNINTEIRVDNSQSRSSAGIITTDSIDGKIKQIYYLRWRRCRN